MTNQAASRPRTLGTPPESEILEASGLEGRESMTRKSKKDEERGYAEPFLSGLIQYSALVEDEGPDFWIVRENLPRIGLEVVTYHPVIQGAIAGRPRKAIEALWWDKLLPILEAERRTRPSLVNLAVRIALNDPQMVPRPDQVALAHELIAVMEALAGQPDIAHHDIGAAFVTRSDISTMGTNRLLRDFLFLPQEEYPLSAKYIKAFRANRFDLVDWPPMTSLDAQWGWLGLPGGESSRTIMKKIDDARDYDVTGSALWLLVVFETHGDIHSHVMPHASEDLQRLRVEREQAGIDLNNMPFTQIWLYSASSRERRILVGNALVDTTTA
jgi:hypothetical protein